MNKFWEELFSLLGTDLWFSTAFHSQTDGQSEVTIRVLENFLRPYVEHRPSTWVDQLPLAKFAADNAANQCCQYKIFTILFKLGQPPSCAEYIIGQGGAQGI